MKNLCFNNNSATYQIEIRDYLSNYFDWKNVEVVMAAIARVDEAVYLTKSLD